MVKMMVKEEVSKLKVPGSTTEESCNEEKVKAIITEEISKIQKPENTGDGESPNDEVYNTTNPKRRKETVTNVLEEINERKSRENNLIVFGIPEKDEESKEERDIADTEKLDELFKDCKIQLDMENLKTVKRLGKFNKEKLKGPILVKLLSTEPKITLFKNIHYIKANPKYAKVGVSNDLTQTEREQEKKLWDQARKQTEEEVSGDYHFKVQKKAEFQENLFIKIRLNQSNQLLLGLIYRSPPNRSHDYIKQLNMLTTKACSKGYSHILIVGDYNFPEINWDSWNSPGDSTENPEDTKSDKTEDNSTKAKILVDYISSVFANEPDGEVPTPNQVPVINEMPKQKIKEEVVLKHFSALKIDKSSGMDKLHPRLLKEIAESIAKPLCIIFNQSLENPAIECDKYKLWIHNTCAIVIKAEYIVIKATKSDEFSEEIFFPVQPDERIRHRNFSTEFYFNGYPNNRSVEDS
ncbi:unnamed protein product [Mytilus coruscus]|uniref:Endonuclease/exonuclease/phosphatase domain-containing protein n=1 Tax=Mytilus coruscus TaxID=42192 RepID=A0A6J8AFD5_MYTCO|nr:unnamed protein product [Mytilus coruscus]